MATNCYILDMTDNEDIRKEVSSLEDTIKQAEKRLAEIQDECKHKETSVRDVRDGNTTKIRIVCKDCDAIVGYPTEQQLKESGYA